MKLRDKVGREIVRVDLLERFLLHFKEFNENEFMKRTIIKIVKKVSK